MGNFCEQYGLPPIAPSRQKSNKHDKNLSDSLEDDFSSPSDSCYQSVDDSSDSPNIKIGCKDSCCNVIKSVNTLTKSEENEKLIIQLINQIQNLELQKEYLGKFKKNLILAWKYSRM